MPLSTTEKWRRFSTKWRSRGGLNVTNLYSEKSYPHKPLYLFEIESPSHFSPSTLRSGGVEGRAAK